jgi:hypothetical protein
MTTTLDEIEQDVESALNNEREKWKLHGGPVILASRNPNGFPFVYFQALTGEISDEPS